MEITAPSIIQFEDLEIRKDSDYYQGNKVYQYFSDDKFGSFVRIIKQEGRSTYMMYSNRINKNWCEHQLVGCRKSVLENQINDHLKYIQENPR